ALTAHDKIGALLLFAKKKAELKRFRVTDAFRLLQNEKLTSKDAVTKATATIRSASRIARFTYLKRLRSLLAVCPDNEMKNRLGLQDCLDDVTDEIEEMYDDDVATAI